MSTTDRVELTDAERGGPQQATDEQRHQRLREINDSCTCGPDDVCSACGDATSEVMDVPTFNQCEVHGKCVDENWNDDTGESHAGCLTPVPHHVKERLRLLHKIDRQRKSLRSALDQRDEAEAERDAALARIAELESHE